LSATLACSCARNETADVPVLKENIHGFFLGEARKNVLKRARDAAVITRAPAPAAGYRGELVNFSRALGESEGVDHVRCAFLDGRLAEIVVYYSDTTLRKLDELKVQLETRYQTRAVAEDPRFEMAQKTYRFAGPGMSITIRRFTKHDGTDLYVQYLHDELHKKLVEKNRATAPRKAVSE
jgi:hypothetical protein